MYVLGSQFRTSMSKTSSRRKFNGGMTGVTSATVTSDGAAALLKFFAVVLRGVLALLLFPPDCTFAGCAIEFDEVIDMAESGGCNDSAAGAVVVMLLLTTDDFDSGASSSFCSRSLDIRPTSAVVPTCSSG